MMGLDMSILTTVAGISALVFNIGFVILTGPNDEEIDLNPAEIVGLRATFDKTGSFHSSVFCIIRSADGKFVGVRETCKKVRELIGNKL